MAVLVVQGQLSLVTMLCILTKCCVLCNKCCVMSIWDVFRLAWASRGPFINRTHATRRFVNLSMDDSDSG